MKDKKNTVPALNILSLEDSALDFEIIREKLIESGNNLQITRVEKESEFISLIRGNTYDIILADFKLPGFEAFGALKLCAEICPDVPFVCVSGAIGEDTAIELLKQGAADYVMKDNLERLPLVLKRALDEAKEKVIRTKVEKDLRFSEKKYRDLVENAIIGIYATNQQGEFLFANQSMCEMLEYDSYEDLKKINVKSTYRDNEEREKFLHNIRSAKRVFNYELVLLTKTGKPIDVMANSFLSGDVITGTMLDISSRKQAEAELMKKMDELQRFHLLTVGRELAMIGLKKEVNELLKKSGQEPKYRIVE